MVVTLWSITAVHDDVSSEIGKSFFFTANSHWIFHWSVSWFFDGSYIHRRCCRSLLHPPNFIFTCSHCVYSRRARINKSPSVLREEAIDFVICSLSSHALHRRQGVRCLVCEFDLYRMSNVSCRKSFDLIEISIDIYLGDEFVNAASSKGKEE